MYDIIKLLTFLKKKKILKNIKEIFYLTLLNLLSYYIFMYIEIL